MGFIKALLANETKERGQAWACPEEDCGRVSVRRQAIVKHIDRKHAKDGDGAEGGGKR